MTSELRLGIESVVVLSLYLALTILIGFVANSRSRSHSPNDYFLGGKTTGALLLFFTMQATQYSGNAFFGFTGKAYRSGLIWILAIPLIGLIITAQLSYAPRLYRLSHRFHYLTPGDFYAHRYQSKALRLIVAILTIVSMFPYLMIQAEATGHAVEALSSGALPFWSGVLGISVVMAIYISVGGWRGVIWTDALQGVLLTIAMLAATWTGLQMAGGLPHVLEYLSEAKPSLLEAPGDVESMTSQWLSLLIVSAIGFAMYPHAIQRIYAAKDETSLKRSFTMMLLVPFFLGGCTLLIGLTGLTLYPDLSVAESDRVFGYLLARLASEHHALVLFVLCGLLAAIMSTASSVVLTLSSIFTRDIYQAAIRKDASQLELTMVGRVFTVVILFVVVLLSLNSSLTLWRLTEIKIEFLMQLFPPLILGLYWQRMERVSALAGLLMGSLVVAAMILSGFPRWWLFQAGLYGFFVNLAICLLLPRLLSASKEEVASTAEIFQVLRQT